MSLVKGIIALINDIWFKRNNVVHGEKVPQPDQDLISDSQAIVSFSSLPFSSSLKPQLSSSNLLSFSMNLASWNLFIRKWKFNCPSFCCISIRNHKRPLQSFTWKRHHVSGDIFSLACFRLTLKCIHCSNLPLMISPYEMFTSVWLISRNKLYQYITLLLKMLQNSLSLSI